MSCKSLIKHEVEM